MEWYKRLPGRYLADTIHLSLAERGAYSDLIDFYYLSGHPIPNDDGRIAAILRAPLPDWLVVAPAVRAFFTVKGPNLHLKRCDQELAEQQKQRAYGKTGGRISAEKRTKNKATLPSEGLQGSREPKERERETEKTEVPPPLGPPPNNPPRSPRGSRLAPEWRPSVDLLAWAKAERADIDVDHEVERFRDYWHARAGPGGVKLDWPATWRNWIRRCDHGKAQPKQGNGTFTDKLRAIYEGAGLGEPTGDDDGRTIEGRIVPSG